MRAYAYWQARRGAAAQGPAAVPTILYFTTPSCVQCRAQQTPAIERLRSYIGDRLQVRQVDALAEPETAERFGILTVPTTVVLDAAGKVLAVNLGFASTEKLASQLGA